MFPGPHDQSFSQLAQRACLTVLSHPLQEAAVEESQKYKEGKYIVEKAKIMKV